jgi:dTDP-4-dehydrorhamnose 3,5-epimerase
MKGVVVSKHKRIKTEKGALVVFLTNSQIHPQRKEFGQIYYVTFEKKLSVRGNHYHKKIYEHFGIVTGRVRIVLENVLTKEKEELILSANKNQYTRIDIDPFVAHAIQSLSTTASLLSYTNHEWKDASDTHFYKLI